MQFPTQMIIPTLVLSMILLSFTLLGDGLRDAFDVKSVASSNAKSALNNSSTMQNGSKGDEQTDQVHSDNGSQSQDNIIEVKNLTVNFQTDEQIKTGVKQVSFSIKQNEVLALVGESGSGKSVSAKAIMQIFDNNALVENGEVFYRGQNVLNMNNAQIRQLRGQKVAMIFQDPFTALNPTLTIGKQVANTLTNHGVNKAQALKKAVEMLELVGIKNASKRIKSFPHQFSGGQLQRICIAQALISEPKLLIADEPTTALDVTVQQQILTLLLELKQKLGFSILFITHDLAVVNNIADTIAVMKDAEVLEIAPKHQIFESPKHIYTKALIAIAKKDYQKGKKLPTIDDFEGAASL
jgi:oligopeptide transport system ATP-binding protein